MADMILDVKTTVAREIEKKIDTKVLPELIAEFLKGPWQEVLKIIGLRDGCNGESWRAAAGFMDDLIGSVQPISTVKQRRRLLAVIPKLLHTLREGLLLIGYDPQEINVFFKKLEKIHVNCVRQAECDEVSAGQAEASEKPPKHEILLEITRQSEKHRAFQADSADPVLLQSHYFQTVNTMLLGTWVAFKDHQGIKRGKLVWKCDFTGEFTFVDRMYKVIADVPMRDLIRQLELGKAHIVSEVPLLERALDAVVNGVKLHTGGLRSSIRLAS
jgi:hypothetical protein